VGFLGLKPISVGEIPYVTMLVGFLSPMQPEPDGSSMSLMLLPAKILVSDNYWLVVSPFFRHSSSGLPSATPRYISQFYLKGNS